LQSANLVEQIQESNHRRKQDELNGLQCLYTKKYAKNPNQLKKCPEFFSKRVGEKLMKMQSISEMLDPSSIIKQATLTQDEITALKQRYETLFRPKHDDEQLSEQDDQEE
jgi:hypothetical protein